MIYIPKFLSMRFNTGHLLIFDLVQVCAGILDFCNPAYSYTHEIPIYIPIHIFQAQFGPCSYTTMESQYHTICIVSGRLKGQLPGGGGYLEHELGIGVLLGLLIPTL